jgi:hypothetical protein
MLPETQGKTFWEKPEGKGAKVITALAVLGAGIGLYFALLLNLYAVIALLAGLFVITVLVTDERFRNLVWYAYKMAMKGLVSAFVVINPIAIAKTYISSLKDKRREMNRQMEILKGQLHKLGRIIVENEANINKHLSSAEQASRKVQEDRKYKALLAIKTKKAGRLKDSNMKYTTMKTKMEALYNLLKEMEFYSGIMIEDLSDEVKQKEIEYNTIKAAHSVMTSAKEIISGGTIEREMFEDAMFKIVDDIDFKVGEMERFMEISENFMMSVDLENGVYEEEGMKMLDEWLEKGPISFGDKDKIKSNPKGYANNQEEPIVIKDRTKISDYLNS